MKKLLAIVLALAPALAFAGDLKILAVDKELEIPLEGVKITVKANPELSVSWSLVSAPAGSAVTVTESGYVSHIDTAGEYVFRATCADGCYEDVVFRLRRGVYAGTCS